MNISNKEECLLSVRTVGQEGVNWGEISTICQLSNPHIAFVLMCVFGGTIGGTIDVGVFEKGLNNVRPNHDKVLLAVECKSGGNFSKDMVRGILGLRRSMSLLYRTQASKLFKKNVPADPPSEIILSAVSSNVLNYVVGPKEFGIELEHLEP